MFTDICMRLGMRRLSSIFFYKDVRVSFSWQRKGFRALGICGPSCQCKNVSKLAHCYLKGIDAVICYGLNPNVILGKTESVSTGVLPSSANFCFIKLSAMESKVKSNHKKLSDSRVVGILCDAVEHFARLAAEHRRSGNSVYPLVFILSSSLSQQDAFEEQVILQAAVQSLAAVSCEDVPSVLIVVLDKKKSSEVMDIDVKHIDLTLAKLDWCDDENKLMQDRYDRAAPAIPSSSPLSPCLSHEPALVKRVTPVSCMACPGDSPSTVRDVSSAAVFEIPQHAYYDACAGRSMTQVLWRSPVNQPLDIRAASALLCNETLYHKCFAAVTEEQSDVFLILCQLNVSNGVADNWHYCVGALMRYRDALQQESFSYTSTYLSEGPDSTSERRVSIDDRSRSRSRRGPNRDGGDAVSAPLPSVSWVHASVDPMERTVYRDEHFAAAVPPPSGRARRVVLIAHAGRLSMRDVHLVRDELDHRYARLPLSLRECLLGTTVLCDDHIRVDRLLHLAQNIYVRPPHRDDGGRMPPRRRMPSLHSFSHVVSCAKARRGRWRVRMLSHPAPPSPWTI